MLNYVCVLLCTQVIIIPTHSVLLMRKQADNFFLSYIKFFWRLPLRAKRDVIIFVELWWWKIREMELFVLSIQWTLSITAYENIWMTHCERKRKKNARVWVRIKLSQWIFQKSVYYLDLSASCKVIGLLTKWYFTASREWQYWKSRMYSPLTDLSQTWAQLWEKAFTFKASRHLMCWQMP